MRGREGTTTLHSESDQLKHIKLPGSQLKKRKHSETQVQISYKNTLAHQLVGTFWESQSQGRDPGAFPGTFLNFSYLDLGEREQSPNIQKTL